MPENAFTILYVCAPLIPGVVPRESVKLCQPGHHVSLHVYITHTYALYNTGTYMQMYVYIYVYECTVYTHVYVYINIFARPTAHLAC